MSAPQRFITSERKYLLALLICCLMAVAAGLVANWRNPYFRTYDAGNYVEVARNILAGRGLRSQVVSNFYQRYPHVDHPEDRRPSAWSLVVAASLRLLGNTAFAAKLPNLLLGLLIVPLLVYFLGRAWRLPPLVAFAGAILLLAWPHWLQASLSAEADVLFTGLTILILLLIVASRQRIGWIIIAGALLGLSYTVKPAALFLIAPLGLYYWLGLPTMPIRQRARWVVLAMLVAAVVASPMLLRNYLAFGSPIYYTNIYTAGHIGFDDSGRALMHVYWDQPLPSLSLALANHGLGGLAVKMGRQLAAAARSIFGGVGLLFVAPCLLVLSNRYAYSWLRRGWLALGIWVLELVVLWAIRPRLLLPFTPVVTLSAAAGGLALAERLTRWPRQATIIFLTVVLAATMVGAGGYGWWHYQQYVDAPILDSYVKAAAWLKEHLPADAAVMSHRPYLVRFYSDHPVVQIPFDEPPRIEQVMRHYEVEALVVQQSPPRRQWAQDLPRDEIVQIVRRWGWELVWEVGEVRVYTPPRE